MSREKKKYQASDFLKGIKKHDRKVLNYIYQNQFESIKNYVVLRQGSRDDAWDVFQEAMGVVYDIVTQEDQQFELWSSFETFFYSVAKNIWLKQLRERRIFHFGSTINIEEVSVDVEEMERMMLSNKLFQIYLRQWKLLDKTCQKMLELTFAKANGLELADKMKMVSAQSAYNKRRSCINKLIQLIINDYEYKNLNEHEKI
ncbi:MAG: hypothetical protein WCR58_07670 [Bacteroidales bacterium]|jgi:DNA-directed RNA polymerase specialized sigma24 family protein|nr:hypothetical protein [Bacteroidales bacterium]MCK9447614.1 hypothetical protein [Bacteroidales bacterium]MDD3701898.1 hypothetical protein [Bacteroidales bacterium]MDY0370459.1 hypothetical protein [Bacteroidales bacterium]